MLRLQRTVPTYRRTWHRTAYSSGNVDTWTMLTPTLGFFSQSVALQPHQEIP
jgi:hypothetical protein